MSEQYEWICKLIKTVKECGIKIDLRYRDVKNKDEKGKWKSFEEAATALTKFYDRDRFPNEFVFDFDNDDEESNLQNIQKVEAVLKTESAPHFKNEYVNKEGKNGIHLHVIFRVSNEVLGKYNYDDLRLLLSDSILKKAGVDKKDSHFDVGLVKDKNHLVRELKANFPKEVPVWDICDNKFDELIKIVELQENLDDYLSYFDEDETEKNYLDIGIANGQLYYGKQTNGKSTILLDDRRVLRNNKRKIRDESGEYHLEGRDEIADFMDYGGNIGEIMPRWKNESIRAFLEGRTVDKNELYAKVRDTLDFYMDFGSDMEGALEVQVCWILGTYIYVIFNWFPHLLFHAPRESGKTKNAKLIMYLSFGGYKLGVSSAVTPATIWTTLDENRGTIILDEFERIEKSESQAIVNQLLNASAERDAYIIKLVQIGRKWTAVKFPIFSPKIVCNITGINITSLTRYIVFQLLKTLTEKGKKKPDKDKQNIMKIRDDLHILMLQHWKEIKDIYDNLQVSGLSNRNEDNWLSIIAVARWLGGDVEAKVMSYIENMREIVVDTGDVEGDFLYILYENLHDDVRTYSVKEVAEWCVGLLEHHTKDPQKWIGRKLSSYKCKKIRRGSGVFYELSKGKIKDRIDRYYPTKEPTQTTLHTQTTQITQTTQGNENTKNSEKSSVVSVVGECVGEAQSGEETTRQDLLNLIKSHLEESGDQTINYDLLALKCVDLGLPEDVFKNWLKEFKEKGLIGEPRHREYCLGGGWSG